MGCAKFTFKFAFAAVFVYCCVLGAAVSARAEGNPQLAELQKLRRENPEEFERIVAWRKQEIKRKLMELKAEDPEKFYALKQKFIDQRRAYLGRLRAEDPQKFHELMQNKIRRLEELKNTNPVRYEEIMRNRPKLRYKLENPGPQRPVWKKERFKRWQQWRQKN